MSYIITGGGGGSGTISGPGSSTDNAIVRWNGTDGTTIQNSAVIVDDNNIINFNTTASNVVTAANYQIGRVFGGAIPELMTLNVPSGSAISFAINGTDELVLLNTDLSPAANDGLALGTSGQGFSDLFLASGAVINFDSSDVTITHSSGLLTFSDDILILQAGNLLTLTNTTDGASVQTAIFEGDRATMADNDEAYLTFRLSNDGNTQTEFARLTWVATDVNAGTSVDGRLDFAVVTAGTLADEMQLDGTALSPSSSDGLALGTTSLMWSDLFLASGSVINFNNGDVTLTHSTNTLAFAGATIYTYDAPLRWGTGVAITAAQFEITRNAEATNNMQYNVPTNSVHFFSINGASRLHISNNTIIHQAACQINDDQLFGFGSSLLSDSGFWYNTLQTADTIQYLVGGDNNGATFCQVADRNFDFAHALQTNPTLFIHSASQSTTQWIGITHDQTDGVITTGAGTLKFGSSAMWTANGTATVTISNVAPAGVGTATISQWFTVVGSDGVTYYIPAWT